ncbi:MAG: hypothetical protein CVU00_13995 [Bacteroidetes bacterium HGW-Bacteroidetes-17]|nr:MAG: hypothetical protein CVU00_13995 [Bacteroidetes bacterium HGW-Bacteroidetes-17]
MKRLFFGIVLTLFVSIQSIAQTDTFNLSDYKLPELKRHALEFFFDLSGSSYYHRFLDSYHASQHYSSTLKDQSQYSVNMYFIYNSYLNSMKKQKESNASFYLFSQIDNNKNDSRYIRKSFDFAPSFYYSTANRNYYKPKRFYEFGIDFKYNFDKYRTQATINEVLGDKFDDIYHNINIFLPLKAGKGRIEQVQDARLANYLLVELEKQKRIRPTKNTQEIIDLAEFISQLKNKRFFDSRLRRIYELEELDSYFKSNDFILNADSRYFTTLSDFWAYGDGPIRNSGKRFSVSLYPGYYSIHYNRKINGITNTENSLNAYLLNAGLEFKYEKPINLRWQNTIDVIGYTGIMEGNVKGQYPTDNKLRIPNLQIGYFQKFGYYPSTRTDATFSYSLRYINYFGKSDTDKNIVGYESNGLAVTSGLSINYYISPKFRLNITAHLNYYKDDSTGDLNYFNNLLISNDLINHFSLLDESLYVLYQTKHVTKDFRISLQYAIF